MAKKDIYHVGIIGAGMISGAYLDNMTSMFGIISVDAIANRNVAKAEKVSVKEVKKAVKKEATETKEVKKTTTRKTTKKTEE